MALIKCPECGGQVSDKASNCPHCGYSMEQPSQAKCPECGGRIADQSKPCPFCGHPPVAPERQAPPSPQPQAKRTAQPSQPAQPGKMYSEEDYYRAAIGENADYYLGKFAVVKNGSVTGHLAAFFVTSPWLLYRKMYNYYFLYILIVVPIKIVLTMVIAGMITVTDETTAKGVPLLVGLPISFLCMAFANAAVYKKNMEKERA